MEQQSASPRLDIEVTACQGAGVPDQWRVSWRIQNLEPQPLEVVAAWLPHDKFHCGRCELNPALTVSANKSEDLELLVFCLEPPSTGVENAYLILQLVWKSQSWRVFARHLVTVDSDGAPNPLCQVITVHPARITRVESQET